MVVGIGDRLKWLCGSCLTIHSCIVVGIRVAGTGSEVKLTNL